MAWDAVTDAEIAVGEPITNTFLTKVKDDLDYLYGRVGTLSAAAIIANGSFESDTDADGTPDNWTMTAYAGGTAALETTIRSHGDQCVKFVHPGGAGNGGGYVISDYFSVSTLYPVTLAWSWYCTAAGMKVIVNLRWYDVDQAYLSSTTIMSTTANPTSWKRIASDPAWPVASARYAKAEMIFGYTDTDVAGTAYCDDVQLFQVGSPHFFFGSVSVPASTTVYRDLSGAAEISSNGGTEIVRGGRATSITASAYPASGAPSFSVTLRKNGSDVGTAITSSGTITEIAVDYAYSDTIAIKAVNSDGSYAATLVWCIVYDINLE